MHTIPHSSPEKCDTHNPPAHHPCQSITKLCPIQPKSTRHSLHPVLRTFSTHHSAISIAHIQPSNIIKTQATTPLSFANSRDSPACQRCRLNFSLRSPHFSRVRNAQRGVVPALRCQPSLRPYACLHRRVHYRSLSLRSLAMAPCLGQVCCSNA